MIKLLYFASLRERLGTGGESIELPAGIATVAVLREYLVKRGGDWLALTTMRNLRVAVNQTMVDFDAGLKDGDEVAFFPPVTGG